MSILAETALKSFIQLVGVLIVFVFVLVLCYLVTRWLGGAQKGKYSGRNLRIIESISLGNNKTVCLLEAGKKYLVVASGKEEVRILAELDREDLKDFSFDEEKDGMLSKESFAAILNKLKDKMPGKTE
ncbi:MAG: flagellar biosynthetic protein FliO [Clostridiales bacterium]|nr:flagellar biosynthetic protein FliO [Clostridiales bacterium]